MKPKLIYRMSIMDGMAYLRDMRFADLPKGVWMYIKITAVLLFALCLPARAQDVHVDCANVNPCTLTPSGGLTWIGANQTWIFTPNWPNTNVYIHLHNQNTTSNHTSQTVTVFQTPFGKPTAPTLTQNSDFWVQDAIVQNSTAGASCISVAANSISSPGASGTGTCYLAGMQAGQIAIRITGANTRPGSPDNVDISITQSQATYPGGPQPGNDSSAGGGSNITQVGGVTIAGNGGAFTRNSAVPEQGVAPILTAMGVPNVAGNPVMTGCIFNNQQANGATIAGSNQFANCDGQGNMGLAAQINSTALTPGALTATSLQQMPPSSGAFTVPGAILFGEKGPRWTITSNPASGTTASASRAAVVAVRHVVDCFTFAADSSAAVVATQSSFVVRDGAAGVGTIIWVVQDAIGVAAGLGIQTQGPLTMCGLNLTGTTNTAMTCEFTDAGIAGNHQSVSCSGYDVQ